MSQAGEADYGRQFAKKSNCARRTGSAEHPASRLGSKQTPYQEAPQMEAKSAKLPANRQSMIPKI
jgi:hypothetical protein